MSQDTIVFLESVYGNIPDGYSFYLWKLSTRSSFWYTGDKIHLAAEMADRQTNMYCGVSMLSNESARLKGEKQRVTNKDSSGIFALHSDVDFGTSGHKKTDNPPTQADAMNIIESVKLQPSLVVHSGHGLQAWWILEEPWLFYDDDLRSVASDLSERWNYMVSSIAESNGWNLDSTYDLARVLRVPGTFNHKPNATTVKTVELVINNGFRYSVNELSEIAPEIPTDRKKQQPRQRAQSNQESKTKLIIDPSRSPSGRKLMLMMDYDPKFHQSYRRDRQDEGLKDKSNSGYDMSLASIAVKAGWSDQEIVDLIMASRRDADKEPETRESYFVRTISNARSGKKQPEDPVIEKIDRLLSKDESAETSQEPSVGNVPEPAKEQEEHKQDDGLTEEEKREEALEFINSSLKTSITRIVRFVASPPYSYAIHTSNSGIIELPTVEYLITQNKLRIAMADSGVYISTFKGDVWNRMAALLLSIVENEDAGESDSENLQSWLSYYITTDKPGDRNEEIESNKLEERKPVIDEDGFIWISADGFRKFLVMKTVENHHTRKSIGKSLRSIGCIRATKTFKMYNGTVVRMSMWRLPSDMQPVLEKEAKLDDSARG